SQLAAGAVGAEYNFQLEAEGGSKPFTWTVTGLPDGIELDAATGILGGSPAKDGDYPLAIAVTDAAGAQATAALSLLVRKSPVFITTRSLGEGAVGELFQARLQAQGGVPPYGWASSVPLPAGLSFLSGAGVLEGTPTEPFEQLVIFRVTDSEHKTDT